MAARGSKITWKRVELAVNRFIKTAETDIARLKQFKKNMIEYENSGNRSSVKLELSRAQQTIKQLQKNLNSIQKLRNEVHEEDLSKFDSKMAQTRMWVMEEINEFANLDADFVEYLGEDFHQLLKTGLDIPESEVQQIAEISLEHSQLEVTVEQSQLTADLEIARDQERQVEQLAADAQDVKEIVTTLGEMITVQGEAVNSIEENVETTHTNALQGGLNLNKAIVAKTAGYTVIGAVCGALLGGPVGLFAGAKIGAMAAGAGMAAGAVAGRKVKQIATENNEMELQNLHVAADMAETKSLRQESVKAESE